MIITFIFLQRKYILNHGGALLEEYCRYWLVPGNLNTNISKLLLSTLHYTDFVYCRRGLDALLSADGWVDQVTSLGREGMFELIRRG